MNNTKIFNGLKWASIELAFDSLIKFGLKLLLAKLLLPEAFGLLGMCMIFIGVSQSISSLGIGAALIQKKELLDKKGLFNTAFWTNLVFAILIYLVISFLVSPLVAYFYGEPILKIIIPTLSLAILIKPFLLIPYIILTRELDFRKLSKVYNTGSLFAGIISVAMAYYGFGVWSLIFNYVLTIGLPLPLLLYKVRWKPEFIWNKKHFQEIFGFGMYATGTSVLRTIAGNVDYLIIGKILGPNLTGVYTLAYTLTNQLRQFLSGVINKVMYPVFGNFQDNPEKLKMFFLTIIRINSILIYPIMAFLIYFAEDIILIFGEEWSDAIIPLRILSVAILIFLIVNTFDTLLRGRGKPKLELKIIAIVNLIVLIPGLYFGTVYYGLIGASYAIFLNTCVLVLVALIVLQKEIGLKLFEPFVAVKSAFFAIAFTGGTLKTMEILFIDKNFYLSAVLFVFIYLPTIWLLERAYFKKLIKSYRDE